MAYETKDGYGGLFKNVKQKENHPDYKGNFQIDGVKYEVAAWLKKSSKGTTYLGLKVQPKREQTERKEAPPASSAAPYDDSDIP